MLTTTILPLVLLAAPAAPAAKPVKGAVEISWYGHSAFLVKSPKGKTVFLDPYPPMAIGYPAIPKMKVDAIASSIQYLDHTYRDFAQGKPKVMSALTTEKPWVWKELSETIGDIKIRSVPGTQTCEEPPCVSGPNGILVLDVGGIKVVHLGNLNQALPEEVVKAIGPVDVLLIPVGGKFTIAGPKAYKVKQQLEPKIATIPMHWKTDVVSLPLLNDYNDFIAGRTGVVRATSNKYVIDPKHRPEKPEIVVLDWHWPEMKAKIRAMSEGGKMIVKDKDAPKDKGDAPKGDKGAAPKTGAP